MKINLIHWIKIVLSVEIRLIVRLMKLVGVLKNPY